MSKNNQIKEANSERKTPWYYYLFGALLFGVIDTALKTGAGVQLGALPTALLTFFCIFFLPRSIWNSKNDKY